MWPRWLQIISVIPVIIPWLRLYHYLLWTMWEGRNKVGQLVKKQKAQKKRGNWPLEFDPQDWHEYWVWCPISVVPALAIWEMETGRHPKVHWLCNLTLLVKFQALRLWLTHDIEIHSVSVYQMLPYLKLLLIKRNVDTEPACLLGSAHHRSFWVTPAQMHYPPCQKWRALSFSPVFSDQLFPPSHLTLLLKIAKQMGKAE